ncbi:glycosyltransferase family 87 protein [Paracoccus benzoatiresistens]|uniref:Glycosyltransferase family 87 protein n=1 Tax=Paracoccus benzoatiresistens TaxID=2997341 RepID=A0ABT4J9J7_9RHOB|nr:glycosyltransferase family 87 protein [Paracoccus sp. EF6]MCZ0963752.1 glycosyltransferase family 87 protein [Paracoccus sp. EF6]
MLDRDPADMLRTVVMIMLALFSIWAMADEFGRVVSPHGLWDFGAFVASGRAAAEGLDPYGIYPLTPHVVLPGFEAWNPNLNPPVSALLFQLFDLAEPERSLRAWLWISVACYAAAVLLLVRRYGEGVEGLLIAIWAFGLAGFWDTLFLGQIYLPLLLMAVGAWLLLERKELVWSGILIGLVVSMKPNFLVWPVLLFLSGHRQPALISGIVAALVSLVPLVIMGPEVYRQWLNLVASDGERAFFLTNASLSGLAARAGIPGAGVALGAVLLLALAAWAFRQRPGLVAASSAALVASVLASPLGWIHYTLFLLPVLLHHWTRWPMWVVGALLVVPVPFVIDQFASSNWVQLTLGSIYGWAVVLCMVVVMLPGRDRVRSASLAR